MEHSLRHFKTALFAILGVAGLGALMESALESGAEIEKLSKKLGASTEALSQFKHVAELSHGFGPTLARTADALSVLLPLVSITKPYAAVIVH